MKFKLLCETTSSKAQDLVFLHSVLEERGRYVPLGWTKPVEFVVADLRLAQNYMMVISLRSNKRLINVIGRKRQEGDGRVPQRCCVW
jgi:hypothetical protein